MTRVFADASHFVALLVSRDALHARAVEASTRYTRVVTTAWVMAEVASYLAAPSHRARFTDLLACVRADPVLEFLPADQELFDRGAELYAARPDKEWSLVDCTSFVVMQRMGISDALTGDRHFVQAGFRALLAEEAAPSA